MDRGVDHNMHMYFNEKNFTDSSDKIFLNFELTFTFSLAYFCKFLNSQIQRKSTTDFIQRISK